MSDCVYEIENYSDDIEFIQDVAWEFFEEGLTATEVVYFWKWYSGSVAASWLIPTEEHIMFAFGQLTAADFRKEKKK